MLKGTPREPEAILDRMTVKRRIHVVTIVLVKWKHQLPKEDTWEFYFDLKRKFPQFNLEDKNFVKRGDLS